ncbi:MAG: glycoside hydrolase family 3 C-terminal domain-containing protein [Clostridiales bacterium]|nr:glycoside hydrolase family 3 C-terminal domain-containing protein [Clostridiales bacterium]
MLTINMSDVIDVAKSASGYLIALGIILVLGIVAMILCRKWDKAKKFMVRAQSGAIMILALVLIINLICVGPMSSLLALVSGEGTISDESVEEASALCVDLAEEGIVLEQNDDDLLPISSGSNLNVFGWASIDPVYGGTGSGALSDAMEKVTLLEGLESAGLNLNTELSDFYSSYCAERPELGYGDHYWTLPEPPADTYTDEMIENAKEFSDTAMIVISRIGGEFADLPTDMAVTREDGSLEHYEDNSDEYLDFPDGTHYLSLSQTEKDMIELVCANFDNVILVYNSANTLELGFVDDYEQIKSVIWCPGPGQTGFTALGEIVTGAVNPSGKATDTFVYDLTATPYFNNIGEFTYTNADEFSYEATGTFTYDTTVPHFVDYVESIYVGYKFYETADEENLIDYDSTVQYPFGHGLSYTTFEQTMTDLEVAADGTISFDVTVTNTGTVAGKDVIEVYYTPPYYNGGIEKASVNLVTFDKTDTLEPGESTIITISFNEEEMASFDTYGEGCYVLEEGDYSISIRSDSHTVLDERTFSLADSIVYDEDNARSSDETAATTAFDFAEGDVTYLSRANGFANYAEVTAAPTEDAYLMSDEIKETFYNTYNWNPEDYNDDSDEMPTTGANNGVELVDLRGLDYDDPLWDDLLDEMTITEMDNLIALGGYATIEISSIGKVSTNDCDGPANISNNFTGLASIGFPSEVIIASTWNVELAEEYGDSIGTMANEMDVSGWYAPGMNTHRSAFDGRNFEYYSEDGVLAGKIAAGSIRGAQSHGVYAYAKHFVLNDQQTCQAEMLCTWTTEQALREIYMKPFELAVKEGGCSAVMSSWNYIGNQWAGACSSSLQTVLRGEWGFVGMVITDGFHYWGYMNSDQAIRNGTDLMLKNYDVETNHVSDTSSATGVLAMRNACHDILYTVVNSRAYDEENLDEGMASWKVALIVIDVVVAVVLVGCEVLIFKGYKKRKTNEK